MKNLKLFLTIIIAGFFAVTMSSCSKKCKDGDPQARIINNGTQNASVQIKTSNGNTVNIKADPGTTSPYTSYAAGQITFTIVVNSTPYVKIVDMSKCYDYDITIDANNHITTTADDRND